LNIWKAGFEERGMFCGEEARREFRKQDSGVAGVQEGQPDATPLGRLSAELLKLGFSLALAML
jgi:hypothetical protein